MRRSLYWQIAVPFVILILLLLAGLTIYFSNYLEKTYLADLEDGLRTQSALLAQNIAPIVTKDYPYEGLEPLIKDYAAITGARVTVVLPSGVVIGDSISDPVNMDNHLDRPEIQKAIVTGSGSDIRFSDTVLKSFLYVAVPIVLDGEMIGFVRLSDSIDQIEETVAFMRRTVAGVAMAAGLIVILLSFLIANRALMPLRKLAREVKHIGSSAASLNVSISRKDEIGVLSQSFTEIADQLSNQMEDFTEERAKLTSVLRSMNDAVILVNEHGKVTLINPAAERIFGTRAEHALGQTLVEVVRRHQFIDLWKSSLSSVTQQIVTLETTPERLFIQAIATPLVDSLPGSTLLVFQDLTRIRHLENVRMDFVANVSHELHAPLASIKAVIETLQEVGFDDPPTAQRLLQKLDVEIDNLTQLVQELLELSRIESGSVPFNLQLVKPFYLLRRAVERMTAQVERAGLKMTVECPENLPPVRADAERIEQVLINLLHNAIKFTPAGGEITASAKTEGGWVQLSVKDNGVGIKPDDLTRIFEHFYKADQSRSGGGTGLGLSIARLTVEAHNGRIWAESVPGEGSTFTISLPLV